ncbi:transmembrane protein 44 [Clinocottus analis]|uniref:transmembrane protein 44 n=1 Tax=Clinocottus analis TaxID=304258 RepID=UPI0035BF2E88
MEDRAPSLEPTGGRSTFSFGLEEFCVDSVTTCLSPRADTRCVPVGLSAASALLSLLSCCLSVYQRCAFRGEAPGASVSFLYSLLGNLCSSTGAVLSGQPHVLVLMGAFAAATDAVHCISCCCHVLLHWNSKAGRRRRMMRGRRRQHLPAVCVLLVVAGGFGRCRVAAPPAGGPLVGRRLLLHAALQDNTEVLGYVLGLLSCVIACTSRFPALCRAYRGQKWTRVCMLSGLLCSLAAATYAAATYAAATYAAATLPYDTQSGFLLRVMPWLLSAICCATTDLLIVVVRWWRKGSAQKLSGFSPDNESLLSRSRVLAEDDAVMKRKRKPQMSWSAGIQTTDGQKTAEMGGYLDVSLQPAGKMRLEEVKDRSVNQTEIRVHSVCSSETSCDSSVVTSDLEWDFEKANSQWLEPTTNQEEEKDDFPAPALPTNPKLDNICTCLFKS